MITSNIIACISSIEMAAKQQIFYVKKQRVYIHCVRVTLQKSFILHLTMSSTSPLVTMTLFLQCVMVKL